MFLGLKILGACVLGIGCVFPASLSIKGWINSTPSDPTIWQTKTNSSFPILTCSQGNFKIQISLEFKEKNSSKNSGAEISFTGRELNSGKTVDLYTKVDGTNSDVYNLTIWKATSWNIQLGEIGGNDSHNFGDKLLCEQNVFEVTEWNIQTPKEETDRWSWEKGFSKVKLTLEDCKEVNGKTQCGIKIEKDVGLKWKPEFTPKVIL